jgi:hypothetical protein
MTAHRKDGRFGAERSFIRAIQQHELNSKAVIVFTPDCEYVCSDAIEITLAHCEILWLIYIKTLTSTLTPPMGGTLTVQALTFTRLRASEQPLRLALVSTRLL